MLLVLFKNNYQTAHNLIGIASNTFMNNLNVNSRIEGLLMFSSLQTDKSCNKITELLQAL